MGSGLVQHGGLALRLQAGAGEQGQEQGDQEALEKAQALLREQQNISIGDRERLYGYLEGSGKMILAEPQSLLTPASKMPGLDGQKMSKSYDNVIALRDDPDLAAFAPPDFCSDIGPCAAATPECAQEEAGPGCPDPGDSADCGGECTVSDHCRGRITRRNSVGCRPLSTR